MVGWFRGGVVAECRGRWKPGLAERAVGPVASGLMAGEGLMGILIAMLVVTGLLAP